jgi:hypothetical protein
MFALHCLSCHILFMPCILFEELFILSPYFSLVVLRNVRRLLFCLGISQPLSTWIGLVLPYILGLDVISFSEDVFAVFLFIGFQQKK